jgi:hypothetical protein
MNGVRPNKAMDPTGLRCTARREAFWRVIAIALGVR